MMFRGKSSSDQMSGVSSSSDVLSSLAGCAGGFCGGVCSVRGGCWVFFIH